MKLAGYLVLDADDAGFGLFRRRTFNFTSTRGPSRLMVHQTIDGEPAEVRGADAREVGRGNPGAALCALTRVEIFSSSSATFGASSDSRSPSLRWRLAGWPPNTDAPPAGRQI
ncbi:MAG: hypothetical protein M3410_04620 [Acidobacteriota bacterium]|nr:hypothetical protein [Acidobacteriota bacterium]